MAEKPPKPHSDATSNSSSAELDQQDLLLKNLCFTIPGQNPESYLTILQSVLANLSGHHLRDLLIDCFSNQELQDFQNQIRMELETMNRVNHARMKSLISLAEPGLRKAVHESLLLFDINPEEIGILNLEKISGYDDAGKPIIQTSEFKVFPPHAAHGIAERERFLPSEMLEGPEGTASFLQQEYPQLKDVGQHEESEKQKPLIALTTIGSLGGIGHKFDSDMDAQVIISTDPEYEQGWTDGDFMLALMLLIQKRVRKYYFSNLLDNKERSKLEIGALQELRSVCSEGLSEEEIQVLHAVFPGTYQYILDRKIDLEWNLLPEKQRFKQYHHAILSNLKEHPEFYNFTNEIKQLYPFLLDLTPEEQIESCFPGSAATGSRELLLKVLADHIRNKGDKRHQKTMPSS